MTRDPPFSNLDLISCRNVLIYFGPVLQKRALLIFHYALRDRGTLMLGSAETIGSLSDLYTPVDKENRVYVKRRAHNRLLFDFTAAEPFTELPLGVKPNRDMTSGMDIQREVDRVVLARYAPAGVVINEDMEVLHFRGEIGSFLALAPGVASLSLLKIAREGLLRELRGAIEEAKQKVSRAAGRAPRRVDRDHLEVNIQVIPITVAAQRCFTVLFERVGPQPPDRTLEARGSSPSRNRARRLFASGRSCNCSKNSPRPRSISSR
jgi:two-component system CheB/CheR fusion protein